MTKLISISGSIRTGSFNERLAQLAVHYARDKGVDAEYINLKDYPMPIYNGDIDNPTSRPENVKKLKEIFAKSDKIIISSPENNASVSPLLKNVIDWLSRHDENETPFAYTAFRSKVAGLLSASPSSFAGIRGLNHLKDILNSLSVIVVPEQLCIPHSHKAFDKQGDLVDGNYKKMLHNVLSMMLKVPVVN